MEARSSLRVLYSLTAVAIAASIVSTAAGGQPPASQPATMASTQPVELPHVRVDLKARRIEMDAQVVLRRGMLEFVVCTKGSKEHESILATPALPSHLHAAMLLLNLSPGKPARWADSPTGEAVFIPPAGAMLKLSFRYTDAAGQPVTVPAHRWLLASRTGQPPESLSWVFVGSVVLESGRYLADVEGEVVSLSNFAGSVIDVPFESTDKNALLEFSANTDAIPPDGTPVTVVIEPVSELQEVARAVFDIDRFGRYELEGRPITVEQISEWARQFKTRYARPYVLVYVSSRATVFDVDRLKRLLSDARISDVEVKMKGIAGEILPRTPEQMTQSLQWWASQFADYRELIEEPGRQAEVVLRQIEHTRQETGELVNLWAQYARRLTEMLEGYRATSQPRWDTPR